MLTVATPHSSKSENLFSLNVGNFILLINELATSNRQCLKCNFRFKTHFDLIFIVFEFPSHVIWKNDNTRTW